MQRFAYPITLAADEDAGGFVVTCRDFPEAITQGDSLDLPLPSKARQGEPLAALPVNSAMKLAAHLAS
jgi:antitoxin HicB